MRIQYRSQENKDFPEQKIVSYPDEELTKIVHGCGLVQINSLNTIIDKRYPCLSPTHHVHDLQSKNKKYKLSNVRYVTRKFYEELKRKGHTGRIIMEECIINVD